MTIAARNAWLVTAVTVLAIALPGRSSAQTRVGVAAGLASYDLAGTGTSGVLAIRAGWYRPAPLCIDVGTSFFWYETQGDESVAMLLPETGLSLELRPLPFWIGAGAGYSIGVNGDPDNDLTLYGAAGLDFPFAGSWAVRPEVRIRSVDPWIGAIAEFTIGIARAIPR
jgi:hypothetical protein